MKMKTEKLKLEHLVPYLLYGIQVTDGKYYYKMTIGISPKEISLRLLINNQNRYSPVLRPLSDMFSDDEMNLKTDQYWIIEELYKVSDDCLAEYEWIDHMIDFGGSGKISEIDFMQCPYRLFQYLLSKHFDVFRLIDSGLAIDINALNQE